MPKSLLSLVVTTIFFFSILPVGVAQELAPLTNADVMTMVRAKLPAALIIEKINNSSCRFDTFPSVLAELKYKGVPDEVLMAMIQAPHGGRGAVEERKNPAPPPTSPSVLTQLTVP